MQCSADLGAFITNDGRPLTDRSRTAYIDMAMRRARCEVLSDDGSCYCEIPDCPGVWANEDTRAKALAELESVLDGWIDLGLAKGDPLPVIEDIET
jgi:predicted RNase H-like HicB family nuclease